MNLKQLFQITCVLVGIAILAYSTNALTVNNDLPYVNSLTVSPANDFGNILRWNAPQPDANIVQYWVYKSTSGISEGQEQLLYQKTTVREWGDASVTQNTTYYYRVRVEYLDGNVSQLSNQVSIKTGRLSTIFLDVNTLDTFAGSTNSVNLTIEAPSDNKQHHITIVPTTNVSGLFVRVDSDDFTLNSGERTDLAINVTSQDDLANGTYDVEIKVTDSGFTQKLTLKVRIGGTDFITFDGGNQIFCNGDYFKDINVTITNNAPQEFLYTQSIKVSASSELFAASISPSDFNLYRGQSKNAVLRIQIDPNANRVGNFYVTLNATQEDANWKSVDRINFTLKDCTSTDNRDFSIGFANSRPSGTWLKGRAYDVNFNLNSIATDFDQPIDINVETSPSVPVSYITRLLLPGNGHVKGTITFYPGIDTVPGDFNFRIIASNGNKVRELKVERDLRISSLSQFVLSTTNDSREIIEDYPADIEFTIKNGDTTQTFNFGVSASEGIQVSPMSAITVQPRSSKTFTVRVYARPGTVGTKQMTLSASTGSLGTQNSTVSLNVKPNTVQTSNGIAILAFPSLIQTDVNREQEVVLSLLNQTEFEMKEVTVSVSGLPEGATFSSLSNITLTPGFAKNVTGILKTTPEVKNGRYEVQFTVQQGRYVTRTKGFVEIGYVEDNSLMTGISTGLASLGQNWMIGLIMILAIIGGLWVISKFSQAAAPRKDAWLK